MVTDVELSERQRIEKSYHDEKHRERTDDWYGAHRTRASDRFWELIGRPRGLTILDFGCGNGWLSVRLAKLGNTAYGFDISGVLVEKARQFAAESNVSDRTVFEEMAAEHLDFPKGSFDRVIGQSILHHTDLEVTLARIRDVLKDDGTALFLEPLNQSPILRAWRALTPWRRTPTERALTKEDLATIRRFFPASRFTYYCLTSMLTEALFLAVPPNRVTGAVHEILEDLDDRLLRMAPWLGQFSAVVVMELRK